MFGNQDVSALDTLDHDKHRMRREDWNPYFSKQSVSRLQPLLIQSVVDKFCNRLAEYQAAGKPACMVHAFACVTTDIISEYSFPKGYNLLDRPGPFDAEHYNSWMSLSKFCHLLKQFGWLYPLLNSMPLWVTQWTSPETYLVLCGQNDLLQQTIALAKQRERPDDKKLTTRPSMMEAFLDSSSVPASEKSPQRIKAEAQTAIGAGTLTSTHALKAATYHILANPAIKSKLLDELERNIPDPDHPLNFRELEQLPYLMACMHETLRIFSGTSHRLQRIFPDRALRYQGFTIPPGTPVSMSAIHIHENPTIFPEPYTFDPERWLPQPPGHKQPPFKYLLPWGKGSRQCVGIELSKAEILTCLAGMMRRFGRGMSLWETLRERDIDTVYDVFNPLPSRESNGLMVLFGKEG